MTPVWYKVWFMILDAMRTSKLGCTNMQKLINSLVLETMSLCRLDRQRTLIIFIPMQGII